MCGVKLPHIYINNKEITIMKKVFNIITMANTMFIGWITISTLQVMLRIGTAQTWNFWQFIVNLMK
jgi:hypothetical protein